MTKQMGEASFQEMIKFIAISVGRNDLVITRDTLIEDDLGVTGSDAEELIVAFGEKYDIDIVNFQFDKYFNDEPGIFGLRQREITPFKVGYLEKAVLAGRLDEDIINN